MGYNIKLVLKRDEDLNALLSKASQLEDDASVFKKRTSVVRKGSRNNYYRTQLLCFVVVLLFAIGCYAVIGKHWQ